MISNHVVATPNHVESDLTIEPCPLTLFSQAFLIALALVIAGVASQAKAQASDGSAASNVPPTVQALNTGKQSVTVTDASTHQTVNIVKGENVGPWTLMAVTDEPEGPLAVFEQLADRRGRIIYVGKRGLVLTLPKRGSRWGGRSAAPDTGEADRRGFSMRARVRAT